METKCKTATNTWDRKQERQGGHSLSAWGFLKVEVGFSLSGVQPGGGVGWYWGWRWHLFGRELDPGRAGSRQCLNSLCTSWYASFCSFLACVLQIYDSWDLCGKIEKKNKKVPKEAFTLCQKFRLKRRQLLVREKKNKKKKKVQIQIFHQMNDDFFLFF